jgi:uncharacterized RDD family membrane protein YckC
MDWFYAVTDGKVGPVSQAEFDALVNAGTIGPDTKVWHDGMVTWALYGDLNPSAAISADPAGTHRCAECGHLFPDAEMIAFENARVCAACKPIFVQKLKEGILPPAGPLNYAGFWIRVGAYILDYIVLRIAEFLVRTVAFATERPPSGSHASLARLQQDFRLTLFIGLALSISYSVYFDGTFGATPGKMALGLKIVRPDGAPIGYLRALGRYFAKILSAFLLGIGFMMAGWDSQCRALHDSICDTRVIRKSGNSAA